MSKIDLDEGRWRGFVGGGLRVRLRVDNDYGQGRHCGVAKMISQNIQPNEVQLLRGGSVVSSFASAFGSTLRETRLTAILGYLIALKPKIFCDEFGVTGTVESVRLEAIQNQDRADILIETTDGRAVVEAKIDATDPFKQTQKYNARWRVLVTQYLPTLNQKKIPRVKYLRWQEISELIQRNKLQLSRGKEWFVSKELINYLEEHNMIPNNKLVEIYARDINDKDRNDESSADLFLKGHIYGCKYEPNSSLAEARYFAPYFGRNVSAIHPGVHEGITYIAKVLSVQVAETGHDFMAIANEVRRAHGFKGEPEYVKRVKEWFFYKGQTKKFCFLFLSVPRLAFNPPIKKIYLRKNRGFLGKGYFTFDEFYKAWGGVPIF